MKPSSAASIIRPLILSILLSVLAPAFAIEAPRIIPRSQEIKKPADQVFATLKKYFTDPQLSRFRLVNADNATDTLVARQSGIDDETWGRWAFCEAGPLQMIYKLQDDSVTVTVKLEKEGAHSTFASVTADFQGVYGLGTNQSKIACTSKFVLEDDILAVASAAPGH